MSEDNGASRAQNAIAVKTPLPNEFKADAKQYLRKQEKLDKTTEQGFVNENNGASIVLRNDGAIGLAASEQSQIHLSPGGQIVQVSYENRVVANRQVVETDDLVVNGHKLNSFVYEAADLRQVLHNDKTAIGGFNVIGTVMVKAWEPDLKRYVMIRRLVRTPLFSPAINLPEIPPGMKISDPTLQNKNLMVEIAPVATATTTPTATTAAAKAAVAQVAPQKVATTAQTNSSDLAEGATWNSWDTQPPTAPAGYEWHRDPGGGMVLRKAYGTA